MLIALCDGHGRETAGKRTPDGIKENQFNAPAVNFLDSALKRCGFDTLLVAPDDTDTPLITRVQRANDAKADLYISIHYNALKGNWDETKGGVETHYHPNSTKGKRAAELVQKYVAQGTPQVNRGTKASNFYVLRETNMPAVLVECGFMDVRKEAALMLQPEFQKETAEQICQGVCEYFNVPYVHEMRGNTPILGPAQATVEQAKQWAKDRDAADLFIDLADLFWLIAPINNVRPEVAYAQSAKETAFGRFSGVINATYHNPCGLKVRAGGGNYDPNAHHRFTDWEEGILAQCQHLALYAGGEVKPPIVDPRHFSFIKGKAPTVEELGGAWAPSKDYGQSIIKNYLTPLMNTVVPVKIEVDWKADGMKNLDGLINSKHDPDSPVTWAELGAVIGKLRKEF